MLCTDRLVVQQNIIDAFKSSSYPYGQDFYKAISDKEYDDQLLYKDKAWEEISEEDIYGNYEFIFFLDNEGVKYYMPSYTRWVLYGGNETCDVVFGSLCTLMQSSCMSIFSRSQCEALLEFFLYCRFCIHPRVDLDICLLDEVTAKLLGVMD